MAVYFNENDPFAAAWLRELIRGGHIADGEVDERSIAEVLPSDLDGFAQCHFFAGIGTWSYALRLAGWDDTRPCWTGSAPCQPFSAAGQGAGVDDHRHLWPEFFRLIAECRPAVVLGEQVASKAGLGWLDLVSADLEGAGYACGAVDLCAAGLSAPHIRQRLWWVGQNLVGHADRAERPARDAVAIGAGARPDGAAQSGASGGADAADGFWRDADWLYCRDGRWRPVGPGTFPLANGAAARVGRLRGYGNAIVAPLAQVFIETVMEIA